MYVPKQVKHLAVLFAALGLCLGVARYFLVPKTFGRDGHYRASAVDSLMTQEMHYAGRQACTECHDDIVSKKAASYHKNVACEVCHGPARDHTLAPDEHVPPAPRDRSYCILCHSYNPSRPTGFPQIDPVAHNAMQACIACHDPHDPVPPEVPEQCAACHAEIARTKAVSKHALLTCTRCHETSDDHKTNPRAVRPGKPANRAFCGQCHSKEADSPREVPRIDIVTHGEGYLCWQCHYPHYPEAL